MFGSLADALSQHLHVIRWDQRGSGRSERRGPYSVARCAGAAVDWRELVVLGRTGEPPGRATLRWDVSRLTLIVSFC